MSRKKSDSEKDATSETERNLPENSRGFFSRGIFSRRSKNVLKSDTAKELKKTTEVIKTSVEICSKPTYPRLMKCSWILNDPYEKLTSSTFSPDDKDKQKWCLKYIPFGKSNKGFDGALLKLKLLSNDKPDVLTIFNFFIKTCEGDTVGGTINDDFHNLIPGESIDIRICMDDGSTNKDNPDFANGFLPYDKSAYPITVECEINIFDVYYHDNKSSRNRLFDDIENLFVAKKFCDVVFLIDGHEFPAHKVIMAASSRRFLEQFERETDKVPTLMNPEYIPIFGIDHVIFRAMLEFIYTGKVTDIEAIAMPLLLVARCYDIVMLMAECDKALVLSLTTENAARILDLADNCNRNELKKLAMTFIKKHTTEVSNTREFKKLARSNAPLMVEILRSFDDEK